MTAAMDELKSKLRTAEAEAETMKRELRDQLQYVEDREAQDRVVAAGQLIRAREDLLRAREATAWAAERHHELRHGALADEVCRECWMGRGSCTRQKFGRDVAWASH